MSLDTEHFVCVKWMIMFPHWIVDYEKGICRECSVGAKKTPIDNTRDAGRCIGIDDQNILRVKIARTKWETCNIKGGVIQRRNEMSSHKSNILPVFPICVL